jgi:ankyrin repeat protein
MKSLWACCLGLALIPTPSLAYADRRLNRALLRAVEKGDYKRTVSLLNQGADPNARDKIGWPALTTACAKGHEQIARALVQHGASVVSRTSGGDWTPLMEAASCRKPTLVAFLLNHGARPTVNAFSQFGHTALMTVHDVPSAKLLLNGGANINAINKDNETPLTEAAGWEDDSLVAFLLANGADVRKGNTSEALAFAVGFKKFQTLKMLIEHGMPVNTGKAEDTPLHTAAIEPGIKYVQYLLDHGANPNQANMEGKTPLMHAAYSGNREAVKLLLEHGAKINATDSDGETALMNASWMGHLETVKLLLAHGANPAIKDKRGRTAVSESHDVRDFQMTASKGFTEMFAEQAGKKEARAMRRKEKREIAQFEEQDRKRQMAHKQVVKLLNSATIPH